MTMRPTGAWRLLSGLVAAQLLVYLVIAWLSREFVFGGEFRQRPIPAVVGWFVVGFALYAASLWAALRIPSGRRLGWVIVLSALAFRGIMLDTKPIQEIDIYRYIWDGAVTSHGISPFQYAPATVRDAEASDAGSGQEVPPDLQQLLQIRNRSPGLADALRRVHYAELTTVYPPVSQAVFALADRLTPSQATLPSRVTVMKGVLLSFDLATIGLVSWLLSAAGRHGAWVICYAWCPLVIKEFANSGHLDSIAVCLTTAAICGAMKPLVNPGSRTVLWQIAAAVLLGLSVGAKLYAVVLLPLLVLVTWRASGFRRGLGFAATAIVASAVSLSPMVSSRSDTPPGTDRGTHQVAAAPAAASDEEPATTGLQSPPTSEPEPTSGLTVFLSRWEMNDFLFLIVVENLRPAAERMSQPRPWFTIIPNPWRAKMVTPVATVLGTDNDRAAFLLTRSLTALIYLAIVAFLLTRVGRAPDLTIALEVAFLTLAWFWLLSPTQNPWYWIWTLPLLPFARGRAWFAMSGLVFVYYLRFWLMYHWPDHGVLNTPYNGTQFFDFIVTWIEFGPWFIWLATEHLLVARRRSHGTPTSPDDWRLQDG